MPRASRSILRLARKRAWLGASLEPAPSPLFHVQNLDPSTVHTPSLSNSFSERALGRMHACAVWSLFLLPSSRSVSLFRARARVTTSRWPVSRRPFRIGPSRPVAPRALQRPLTRRAAAAIEANSSGSAVALLRFHLSAHCAHPPAPHCSRSASKRNGSRNFTASRIHSAAQLSS